MIKNIVEEYVAEVNTNDTQVLLKPEVYMKDIFGMSPEEILEFVLNNMCKLNVKKQVSASHMRRQRYIISRFFDWCVEHGYLLYNKIEDIEMLGYRNMLFELAERSEVNVYYKETLPRFDKEDEMKVDVILYLLYHRFKNLEEVASLRLSDIDFDNRIINLKNRSFRINKNMLYMLIEYIRQNTCLFIRLKVKQKNLVQYKDYILKVYDSSNVTDEKSYKKTCKRIFEERLHGEIDIRDIVMSGILNDLREELKELNNHEFSEFILEDARNSKWKRSLNVKKVYETVFMKHGYKPSTLIKDELSLYLAKSKYYI